MSPPSNPPNPAPEPRRKTRLGLALAAVFGLVLVGTMAVTFWPRSPNPDQIYEEGLLALKQGRVEVALGAAGTLQEIPSHQAHSALLTGGLLIARGDAEQGVTSLVAALEHPQTRLPAHLLLAEAYYHLGMFRESLAAGQAALTLDPQAIEARRWLASAYYDLGDNAHAEEELKLIAAAAPTDSGPCRLLGLMYKDSERFPEAAQWLREALQRQPPPPHKQETELDLAEVLLKQHDYQAALDLLKPIARSARGLAYQAEAKFALGDFEAARKCAGAALELDPQVPGARLLLGQLELTSGSPNKAVQILKQAAREHPAQPDIFQMLSQAYLRVGRKAEADTARAEKQRLSALVTEFAEGHVTAARQPGDAAIRLRLGQLAVELGRADLARVWFQAALALDPSSQTAQNALRTLSPPPPPPVPPQPGSRR